jgi:hypothetical protein
MSERKDAMTAGVVKTQGSELYFTEDTSLSGADFTMVKLACPTGITGLGGAADQIETTCLDTANDREYARGLGNPGQVTVPFNFIPTNVSHQLLFELKEAGDNLNWLICFSDGVTAPTIDSDGNFTAPSGRTSIAFNGYIADVNIDIATNEIVRGTLLIQRSGAVTPYYNAP